MEGDLVDFLKLIYPLHALYNFCTIFFSCLGVIKRKSCYVKLEILKLIVFGRNYPALEELQFARLKNSASISLCTACACIYL